MRTFCKALLGAFFIVCTPAIAGDLPDATMTPGAVSTLTSEQLCAPGFTTKTIRHVSASLKRQVYAEYEQDPHAAPCPCEVDHLVSLELGGSNAQENLWPEPYQGEWNAHLKDKLENRLHRLVCEGQITLDEAQHEISTDWIAAYRQWMHGE
jgi:hypothetical protein